MIRGPGSGFDYTYEDALRDIADSKIWSLGVFFGIGIGLLLTFVVGPLVMLFPILVGALWYRHEHHRDDGYSPAEALYRSEVRLAVADAELAKRRRSYGK